MLKKLCLAILVWCCSTVLLADNASQNPDEILKQCIQKHGGAEKFTQIQDICAKMDVRSISDKGDIESVFYEYFRKPDKLRIEIHPLLDPPTKLGWDGLDAWHFSKEKLEKSDDTKLKSRLQESLKFIKLMVLTNLFEKGNQLTYERHIAKSNFGIHVISQINDKNEKVKLYIHDTEFVLLGAEFYWDAAAVLLRVMFAQHKWFDGIYLPVATKVYKESQLVMEVKLKTVQVNSLQNGNKFFSDLKEKAQLK